MLDSDQAEVYGTSTKALNQAVKPNRERFPADFMFRLTAQEKDEVVTNCDHLRRLKYSPALPHAFTERGEVMLAEQSSRGPSQYRRGPRFYWPAGNPRHAQGIRRETRRARETH